MARVPTAPAAQGQTRGGTTFQNVGASAEDFGAAEGRALSGAGKAVQVEGERQFAAQEKVRLRRDTLDRLKRKEGLNAELFNLFDKTSKEQDITDPAVLVQFGTEAKELTARSNAALQEGGTTPENAELFAIDSQSILAQFRDQMARQSVAAVEAQVAVRSKAVVSDLSAAAGDTPEQALALMTDGVAAKVGELAGSLRVDQEEVLIRDAQKAIAQSAVNTYFSRGDAVSLRLGMELLDDPTVKVVVSDAERRTFLNRASTIGDPLEVVPQNEVAGFLGIPEEDAKGIVVTRDNNSISIILKPTKDQTIRKKKIEALVAQNQTLDRATNLVDGNIEFVVIEKSGEVVEINRISGEVIVRKKAIPQDAQASPVNETPGLYQKVLDTPTSGLGPAVLEVMVDILGQIPGVSLPDIAKESVAVRQDLLTARNTMIQAFSLNTRYPAALVKLIISDTNMEVSVFKSDRALLIRMVSVAKGLRRKIAREQKIVDNPNQGIERREAAATAVADMSNFLDELRVPEDADPTAPEDPPVHIINDTQWKALAPGTPFIGPDGVRRTK